MCRMKCYIRHGKQSMLCTQQETCSGVFNLPSHLRQVVHHATPSPISNSPVSNLSTSLFLKNLKTHLFHSSFPSSVVCIHLWAISGLLSPVLTKLRLFFSHTFRYHSPSHHSRQFLLFDL